MSANINFFGQKFEPAMQYHRTDKYFKYVAL